MLCLHCNAHYLLENPLSSILALHPRIRAVLQYRPCHRICTWLGMYGARTPKPINLWSDDPFVNKLKRTVDACVLKHSAVHSGNLEGLRFRDLGFFGRTLRRNEFRKSDLVRTYRDSSGKKRFQGNIRPLRASGEYPLLFGKEVPRLHCSHCFQKGTTQLP